jgi:hypothetical protein
MPVKRYDVKNVVIETPLYGGHGGMSGVAARGVSGEQDILGHGWAEIEIDSITIAVKPRGMIATLEPKEKRTYVLADITSWVLPDLRSRSESDAWDCSQRMARKLQITSAKWNVRTRCGPSAQRTGSGHRTTD